MKSRTPVTAQLGKTVRILNAFFLSVVFVVFTTSPAVSAITPKGGSKTAVAPYVVILDPGHGGSDTGAVGVWQMQSSAQNSAQSSSNSTRKQRLVEKEVVLDLARRVQIELENEAFAKALGRPIRIVLTRESDGFVSLDQRAFIARQAKADLFVSLHANAETTGSVRGFEIYYLDNSSKESYSHHETLHQRRKKIGKPKHKDSKLALLLRSIATDSTLNHSKLAAKTLQKSILNEIRDDGYTVKDRGIRRALLQVLLDAETPGVLIEALYLSHPQDRKLIQHPQARNSIASGIAKGILKYLILSE